MIPSFQGKPYAQRHFRAIVEHARRTNPFYAGWIVDPENPPIIDRATFLANNDEILNGHPITARTSGSTGIPVRVSHSTERQRLLSRDVADYVRLLGGPLPRAVLVHLYDDDPPREDTLSIKEPLDRQLAFIEQRRRDVGAKAITTYPTNAATLSQAVIDRGLDMSFVARFGMYGECVEPFHEELVRQAFPNAQIWTTYSSMEVGLIAFRCPYSETHHHIMANRLGVEVLRSDDAPAAIGERGRVVITDYFNRQAPIIRYELGDYAVREPCPCGRIKLPAFRHIYGKIRGALLHRNGERVLFADLSVSLRDLPGMGRYQVIQHDIDRFTVKVVADRNLDAEIRTALERHFGYQLGEVRIQYVDDIPLGPNGKFYATICEV